MTDKASFRSFGTILTVFLSVSSATVIVLALLGYGVALSADSRLGVPHAILFNSTSDLLTLGGWGVVEMLSQLDKLREWAFYVALWTHFWPMVNSALIVATVALVLSIAWVGIRQFANARQRIDAWRAQRQTFFNNHRRTIGVVAVPAIVMLTILVVWPLLSLAVLFGVVVLGLALSFVPLIGLWAGTQHIDNWVIDPEICTPLRSRDVWSQEKKARPEAKDEKPKAASCVAIKNSDGKEYRGRVVFATFNAIVLYDPQAGTVQRVSTDGASVEVIDAL